ncbi:MAG: thioredoxin family protein, partial [Caulobacteraceae bacterium]|nr:thioredoxin family protein [Caulobacteraceae bacterium]
SLKAAALAAGAADPHAARIEAIAFLVGVLATFLALAGVLIAARAGGAAVGWGFQLQDPRVVAALMLVLLAAALNLAGLFEIGLSLQAAGGSVATRGGWLGSALTGALAVVVAAPCTAPFMGPALGYALTQPAGAALAVFAALALGFAAPFALLALSPALTRRLPRPGAWMETFRQLLAFPMLAAAAWLLWVLARQTDAAGLARALAAAVVLSLAAWGFGRAQRSKMTGGPAAPGLAVAALAGALAAGLVAAAPWAPSAGSAETAGALKAQPWSEARVAELAASGRPVLVNFTAAWCVTCQVNERAALASPAVAAALARTRAAYLVADWTSRDPAIGAALKARGRIGVPLYLVYGRGPDPEVLPQILTPGRVAAALDRARGAG